MKFCYICKENLSEESFYKNRSKPDGLATECKKCSCIKSKEYIERNKEKVKERRDEYYLKNREREIKKACDFSKNNRSICNRYGKITKNRVKSEVFSVYSCGDPICKNCGENDLQVLTIDHINGDGGKHRRELGGKNFCGSKFYRWLRNNNHPPEFQVLCFNCQFDKAIIENKPKNPTPIQVKRANYVRSIKIQCLNNYGGCKCKNCQKEEISSLSLDHVNDDGKHYTKKNSSGFVFYLYLRRNNFPNDPPLQVLCMNCNIKKRNLKYQKDTEALELSRLVDEQVERL